MLNNLIINKDAFINNVILPYYQGLNHTDTHYIIYDLNGAIIDINEQTLKNLGYNDFEKIRGKTLAQIYKLSEKYPELCSELEKIRNIVTLEKSTQDHLCATDFSHGIKAYLMQHTPILYIDGKVIGSALVFNEVDRTTPLDKIGIFSERQEEIIFLLSVGGSQKETASILNTTRGTVAKTLESIGVRLNTRGVSKCTTTDKAAQLGCGKLPMSAIKPGIVPLSKLYSNNSILSLFNHF